MTTDYIQTISRELNLGEKQVSAVTDLLMQDSTVPFIARYRKEATGSLDEVAITSIRDRLAQLKELDARKETVLNSLEKQGVLNDELQKKIHEVNSLPELEDIYLPYKPKRRTRATIAREKGLEPLAMAIFEQTGIPVSEEAGRYINAEKKVDNIDDALSGARDIIAEIVNEHSQARSELRRLFMDKGLITCTVAPGKEEDGKKYKDYFNWQEPANSSPSHRILAMRRGEKEDILNFSILPPEDQALHILDGLFIKGKGDDSDQVSIAIRDSYKRMLSRSMETETRLALKEKADVAAIAVFSDNLRQLLLASPLGPKRVMAIDPGFRTGCKVACLDRQGKLLHYDTIYPNMNEKNDRNAEDTLVKLCEKFQVEAIAIGNGTAGRETEAFVQKISFGRSIPNVLVNESGASIYSASETAREEFPDLDLTIRGAVSIGRRLMDPLSELVKIDPKSIGVGQYQHDVDQTELKKALDDCVVHCVNAVGVDVNRASAQLLTYVSGLGPGLAKNIVQYRNDNGAFTNRRQLTKVPRLGPKAFEQCAGFLRITDGEIALDKSAVHPESYPIVDTMARDLACSIENLMSNKTLRDKIDINRYVTEKTGIPTLQDILQELAKPGRDPREEFKAFSFAEGIAKISDLSVGMTLPGIITNVTAFGAFVDVGVHQDGLVHISEMADHFVKDPSSVVKIGQRVNVRTLEVDIERNRISLSMKSGKISETVKRSKKEPKASMASTKQIKGSKGPRKNSPRTAVFNNPFAEIFDKKG